MKFTKFLVLLLSLSMLLVSCDGNGGGGVTTESEGSTTVPDSTTGAPVPDSTTGAPAPGSQWKPATDEPTNIVIKNYGSIVTTININDIIVSNHIDDEERFADLDSLIAAYRPETEFSLSNYYIVQFTPTEDYIYEKGIHRITIRGIIDKKYSGDSLGCNVGDEIQIWDGADLIPPAIADYQYVLKNTRYVFRKGYSYFVCLDGRDREPYVENEYYICHSTTAFEYSSLENQQNFLDEIGGVRDFSLIEDVFERYPMVESKHKWE